MPEAQPRADTSSMRCGNCGAEIWTCSSCHGTCSAPGCDECVSRGEAGHEDKAMVVLPQLDSTSYDW